MRDLITLVEKYSRENQWLLHYLASGDRFDQYRAWHVVGQWVQKFDMWDEFSEAAGEPIHDLDDLEACEPEIFEKLDPSLQEQCAQWVADWYLRYDPADAPSTSFFDKGQRISRDTWLVHFTNHAWAIAKDGFTHGEDNISRLGLTTHFTHDSKAGGGYNFAFEVGGRDALRSSQKRDYGSEAVMFQNSGIKAYHYGDEEDQVIFWGPEVDPRSIIVLDRGEEADWAVYTRSGDLVYEGTFDVVTKWVVQNAHQYRRQLTGS